MEKEDDDSVYDIVVIPIGHCDEEEVNEDDLASFAMPANNVTRSIEIVPHRQDDSERRQDDYRNEKLLACIVKCQRIDQCYFGEPVWRRVSASYSTRNRYFVNIISDRHPAK